MYRGIYCEEDGGMLSGYAVSKDKNNWHNYLNEWLIDYADIVIEKVNNSPEIENVFVLKNIYVEEGMRGQGIGGSLMGSFFDELEGGSIVLLSADLKEGQQEGFDLVDWYKGYGFYPVASTSDICLMALDDGMILENIVKCNQKKRKNTCVE